MQKFGQFLFRGPSLCLCWCEEEAFGTRGKTLTTFRDMMIMKLMQTPVPEVANCQFFFTNSHWKEANFSMAMSRNTTTANTAVRTREIWKKDDERWTGWNIWNGWIYIYWNLAEVSLYKVRYIFDMHCLLIQGHQRETVIYGSAALWANFNQLKI